ncbi:uncharacterized protein [Primulina eburnea]|uniref:uncharacterized protein n=1 Tax=Primulina eburnea TaxID=1245227 RepID=UPI003C6BEFA5
MEDADRVRCVTYMFRDFASLWWERAEHGIDIATLNWARFKEIFYEKYFTVKIRGRLKREFMSLRQGDSTVAEFMRKFDRDCHFLPLIARDPAEKLRHFLDGLRPVIRPDVMMMRPIDYATATAYAFQAEQALKEIDYDAQRKRRQHQHHNQPNKKPYTGPPRPPGPQNPQEQVKKQGPQKPPNPGAPKPGRRAQAADCPKKNAPTVGRAYVMNAKEADEEADITLITGRIIIQGVATYALLDSEATHSFISETFIKQLNIPEDMGLGFKVSIPSGDQMLTSKIVKNLELRLFRDDVRANLIVLPMPEFDIILGRDWLSMSGASIDFRQRSVSIRPPSAHAPISQKLEDVDIVRDFPNIFPEDVSGILPDREVEFSIELMSGTPYLDRLIIVFIDDILIYSKNKEEHSRHLRTTLQVLQDRKLFAKFSKCEFWLDRVVFLCHIISSDGFEVDPIKVEAVKEWPVPKSVTEIRSFLGLADYYRKFIKGFSSIAVTLTSLTKILWGSESQDSFDKLKQALISAPVLSMPSGQGDLRMKDRWVVPDRLELRQGLLRRAQCSRYYIHPVGKKMYKDLRSQFWWKEMKHDVIDFLYTREIVRLHGIPVPIISDRDPRFTFHFWEGLQTAMGTELRLSISYHPQTDGQTEHTIQTLEDMLRAYVMDFKSAWQSSIPLVEFAYNNSYHSSIQMAPFEALYGRRFTGPEMIHEMEQKVKLIQQRLKAAQDRQAAYANKRRRPLEFQQGDRVFLKVSHFRGTMRFGMKEKLAPRYVGPYEILQRIGTLAYQLALPPSLSSIHDVFHVSMLQKYEPDPSHVLDIFEVQLDPDVSYVESPVRILNRSEQKLRSKLIPMVKVQWEHRGVE